MKVNYYSGSVSFEINLHDQLLDNMNQSEAAELIESLSCSDAVINHVMDQIFDGWTISGYHGSRSVGVSPESFNGLDLARRRVAECSGDVAKKEIDGLKKTLEKRQEEINRLYAEIRDFRQSRQSQFI